MFAPLAGFLQAVFVLLPLTATTQPGHLSAPTPPLVVRRQFSEPEKPDYLYYVDKVNGGYIDPGADPKQSKYIASRGLPIAPKSYKDLYTRGNDPSVKMWVNAGETEWTGLIGRQSFIHAS